MRREAIKTGAKMIDVGHVTITDAGRWLELLKEIAPKVTRVVLLRDIKVSVEMLSLPQFGPWRGSSASS